MNEDRLLTQKEAAAYLSISPTSLERLKQARKIGYIKLSSKCVRYRESDCREYLKSKYVHALGTTQHNNNIARSKDSLIIEHAKRL